MLGKLVVQILDELLLLLKALKEVGSLLLGGELGHVVVNLLGKILHAQSSLSPVGDVPVLLGGDVRQDGRDVRARKSRRLVLTDAADEAGCE